ncbi:M16 family metallopeptidase [Cumulibacter soli]|uniref:M16 family metallopeptidase n=1 Tax=Cumulibacter soli TaxID=2546344 RepID=UPI001068CE36|nr:pitrilysin family protein [Cumulibacter soli]
MTSREIPGLAAPNAAVKPRLYRRTLSNGLRVIAIRRPSAPMVEVRLRIEAPTVSPSALGRTGLWSETLLKGTEQYDDRELDQAIGGIGAQINTGADRDKLMVGGSTMAEHLSEYLGLLAHVLSAATFPKRAVEDERGRLAEHLVMAKSNAGVTAAQAIAAKLFGDHPYARVMPEPDELTAVSAAQVRSLHRALVRPDGAVLVLVGDLQPRRALDLVEASFAQWTGTPRRARVPAVRFADSSTISVVDRPGSVQSSIRFGMPALSREHTDYPAQRVANMLFGGYFSSRLVANLREDKGYTYTPRSAVDLGREASVLTISADVSTEVTAAAINEINYELGRLANTTPTDDEVENARQYLIGSQLISMSSQAGLAGQTANLEIGGLGLDWLQEHQRALAKVSAADVRRVAAAGITPAAARIVVVGDAARIDSEMGTLGRLERASADPSNGE